MRVSVVGLGPGPLDWMSPAAASRLRLPGARVFARTRFFPSLERVLEGVEWQSFDDLYEQAESLAELEVAMAERLLEAGAVRDATQETHLSNERVAPEVAIPESVVGEVVLAVPGDGILGEAVLARLREGGATVEVVPGMPPGVSPWAAAGLAANDGGRFV